MEARIPVLVCFALEIEAAPFRDRVRGRPDIHILLTGIGPRNAEGAVRAALRGDPPDPGSAGMETAGNARAGHPCPGGDPPSSESSGGAPAHPETLTRAGGRRLPGAVLSCGFAGGLNPRLARGEVVFDAQEAPRWADRLQAAGARPARFNTSTRIAATAAEKHALRERTAADAVDMESEAIHRVCREYGVPCATVRVISDVADEDLPLDFNAFLTPEGRLRHRKLALAVLKAPGRVATLWQLQRRSRQAAVNLARVLAGVMAG
jgi:hypothetical protein